jgi:glycosyltransferase involved in cell wall biosynthesis
MSAGRVPPWGSGPGREAAGAGGAGSVWVGVTAEQALAPVPGGIGRYVTELAWQLPPLAERRGGGVVLLTGRHRAGQLDAAGLDPARTKRLRLPGRVLNRTWVDARLPRLPGRLLAALDVVHATSLAVPPAGRRPLVVTVHDLAFRHHPEAYPRAGRAWHERALRRALAEAAMLLVPSRATAGDLAELYGVERQRIAIVPLGVSLVPPDRPAAVRLLARLEVPGPFVLAVGTLEPRKNLRRLVAAFNVVSGALPAHHLVLVGPSGWGRVLGELPAGVRLAGRVPDPVLHGLYSLADAVAYPSLYEGFGLPVLEAMAHGVPVLTGDRSSLPELVGDAALLVDPSRTEAIAAGLERVVADEELRARLRAAGPARAARFTWAETARETWAVYERVG